MPYGKIQSGYPEQSLISPDQRLVNIVAPPVFLRNIGIGIEDAPETKTYLSFKYTGISTHPDWGPLHGVFEDIVIGRKIQVVQELHLGNLLNGI